MQSTSKISALKNKSANCRLVERHQRAISRFAVGFVDVSVMLGMALDGYFTRTFLVVPSEYFTMFRPFSSC